MISSLSSLNLVRDSRTAFDGWGTTVDNEHRAATILRSHVQQVHTILSTSRHRNNTLDPLYRASFEMSKGLQLAWQELDKKYYTVFDSYGSSAPIPIPPVIGTFGYMRMSGEHIALWEKRARHVLSTSPTMLGANNLFSATVGIGIGLADSTRGYEFTPLRFVTLVREYGAITAIRVATLASVLNSEQEYAAVRRASRLPDEVLVNASALPRKWAIDAVLGSLP